MNLHLFGALLLSGFFMRRNWRVRSLLLVYMLPWAVPAIPTFIAIHWMLNGEWGFLNNLLYDLFGINGPSWLNYRWLALGSVICRVHLEMDAVLDGDLPCRTHGDPAANFTKPPTWTGQRDCAASSTSPSRC